MAQPEESEPLPRPPTHVDTDMFFLDRLEAYKHTKPYMITFDAGGLPGPKTNHAYSKHPVCVHDARQDKQRFSLDSHGFQFRDWTSAVAGPAFDDDDAVRGVYYAEIRRNLRSCFPYLDYVHVFAHLRRKRSADFGGVCKEEPRFWDPIVYAHTDFTADGAATALESFLGSRPDLRSKKMSIVNVWRVTNGPTSDWPIAFCDYNTVAPDDVELNDVIHRTYVGESTRLQYSQSQKWYFLRDQAVDEVALFRNTDSTGLLPVAFHLSFPGYASNCGGEPRESIEVRTACFYD